MLLLTDIDECLSDVCVEQSSCENTDGSYSCVVKPGFKEIESGHYEGNCSVNSINKWMEMLETDMFIRNNAHVYAKGYSEKGYHCSL